MFRNLFARFYQADTDVKNRVSLAVEAEELRNLIEHTDQDILIKLAASEIDVHDLSYFGLQIDHLVNVLSVMAEDMSEVGITQSLLKSIKYIRWCMQGQMETEFKLCEQRSEDIIFNKVCLEVPDGNSFVLIMFKNHMADVIKVSPNQQMLVTVLPVEDDAWDTMVQKLTNMNNELPAPLRHV